MLLGHPGGPYFANKDLGYWSIPKGEVKSGEELLAVALREFEEETGHAMSANALGANTLTPLGWIVQKGGKVVHAWAAAGDLDPTTARSNTFRLEWPPHSGVRIEVPEIDRVAWLTPPEARRHVKITQVPFIDRLEEALGK